jgi:hypothetical protein
MNKELLTVLSSLLSLAGLVYLYFWIYRGFIVDSFRQDLFHLRDEVFDYAADGNISFDHDNYGMLRSTINGYIQHAHRMTLWHALVLNLFIRDKEMSGFKGFDERWSRIQRNLTPESKEAMNAFRKRMDDIVFRYVMLSAPECVLLTFPVVLLIVAIEITRTMPRKINVIVNLRSRVNKLDDTAYVYGAPA